MKILSPFDIPVIQFMYGALAFLKNLAEIVSALSDVHIYNL